MTRYVKIETDLCTFTCIANYHVYNDSAHMSALNIHSLSCPICTCACHVPVTAGKFLPCSSRRESYFHACCNHTSAFIYAYVHVFCCSSIYKLSACYEHNVLVCPTVKLFTANLQAQVLSRTLSALCLRYFSRTKVQLKSPLVLNYFSAELIIHRLFS